MAETLIELACGVQVPCSAALRKERITINLFTQPQGRTSGLNACDQSVDEMTMPGQAFRSRWTIAV